MEETLKILVVDDDEVDRMAVRRSLTSAGVQMVLTEVSTSFEAIAALQSQDFDCVLLDYRLPDADGIALVQAVKQAGMQVPVVVLTGQGDEQIAVEVMKAGAADYLSKSRLSPENLSRRLSSVVRIHRAEMQVLVANQRLKESEERYRFVLEGSNDGIWDWDLVSQRMYWNDRCLEIMGISPQAAGGTFHEFMAHIDPQDQSRFFQAIQDHLHQGLDLNLELKVLPAPGQAHYCTIRGKAQRNRQGQPVRMSGILSDITERKQAEERDRFLAQATGILSASLDYERTLLDLAHLSVPFLADLCTVDILDLNGELRRLGVAAVDHQQRSLVKDLMQHPPDLNSDHPVIRALRTGRSILIPHFGPEDRQTFSSHGSEVEQSPPLEICSYLVVPLLVRDYGEQDAAYYTPERSAGGSLVQRKFGALTFIYSHSGRCYREAELELAEELARRASLSVENGQLYRESREASHNLRQAILILGEQQQQLRTLQHLTNLLNQRLTDLPGLLRVMVGAVCEAIGGAQFCFIMLHNPQCDDLVLTVTAGMAAERLRLEATFGDGEGLLSQVFLTGESQLIRGPALQGLVRQNVSPSLPSDLEDPAISKEIPAAIYVVAIQSARGRLGVLAIGNWHDPEAFDEEDCHLLRAVGEQAAIAINNARMISALEEREERLAFQNNMLVQQNQELENLSTQIQLQNLKLMEAARLKSQFMATMSHELRTPMNAIIGFSQLLLRQRQTKLSSQQLDMVERIFNNGKHLLTLINDILDLSKIEAGRLELKLEEFNLSNLVGATIDELRSLADEKQLQLKVQNRLKNPLIWNDVSRLRQILINLLSNGIKFTEKGSVEVEVWEEDPETICLAVRDTGIGIDPENIDHIFEEFRQLDQSLRRRYEGTGLGLAITHSLIELMQGKISVTSELGQGSSFQIELPRRIQTAQNPTVI